MSAPASDEPAVTASVPVSARTTDDEVTSLASSGMFGYDGEDEGVTEAAFTDSDADDVNSTGSSGIDMLGSEVRNSPHDNEVDDDDGSL